MQCNQVWVVFCLVFIADFLKVGLPPKTAGFLDILPGI